MMRGSGLNFLKFMTVSLVVFGFSAGCKQSVAEKNAQLVQKEIPALTAQKDSLKMDLQVVKNEYQVLKSKIAQVPADKLNKPENAGLSELIETITKKSEMLEGSVTSIESRLQSLVQQNNEKPSEEVQHEIEVLKQTIQAQQGRMSNYLENYKKLESRLDSLQK